MPKRGVGRNGNEPRGGRLLSREREADDPKHGVERARHAYEERRVHQRGFEPRNAGVHAALEGNAASVRTAAAAAALEGASFLFVILVTQNNMRKINTEYAAAYPYWASRVNAQR